MAKILKKGGVKSSTKSESTAKKTVSKTTTVSSDASAWVTRSKSGTKAHDSKVKVCELLLEREYSDEEIALMVESELEYKITANRVAFYRRTLNKGQFEPLGFDPPDEPVQPIEKDGVPAKAPAKASAKSKATTKKTIGKKKIVLKK